MKPLKRLGLILLLVFSFIFPVSVSAPLQEIKTVQGALTIIQGSFLKAMSSPLHLGNSISVLGVITAYSKAETCPQKVCITASGQKADYDIIACPRELELGTLIEIEEKIYECGDRTAKWVEEKYGNVFDIWMGENYNEAIKFGRQYQIILIYYNEK